MPRLWAGLRSVQSGEASLFPSGSAASRFYFFLHNQVFSVSVWVQEATKACSWPLRSSWCLGETNVQAKSATELSLVTCT